MLGSAVSGVWHYEQVGGKQGFGLGFGLGLQDRALGWAVGLLMALKRTDLEQHGAEEVIR